MSEQRNDQAAASSSPRPVEAAVWSAINHAAQRVGRRIGMCRLCEQERAMTRHHLVPQRVLRREGMHLHEPALNLIRLCTKCHRLVESKRTWRARLRAVLTPEEIEYGQRVLGVKEFAGMYPPLDALTESQRRRPWAVFARG